MSSELPTSHPLPNDFIAFLPYACKRFNMEEEFIFNKIFHTSMTMFQSTQINKSLPKSKRQLAITKSLPNALSSNPIEVVKVSDPKKTIVINVIYDNAGNICHLKFNHKYGLPRELMKIIGMTLQYHKGLNSLTFNSGANKYAIHEINNFLPISYITDICFDNCVVREANYDILLDYARIRNISLARCSLDDDFVIRISSKIRFPRPASKTLACLNLSSNRITDVGAISLAEALRTNRCLRYLNLSGNQLNDEGAVSILSFLLEYPLTVAEILLAKEARIDYERALANAVRELGLGLGLDIESKESKSGKGKQRKGKFEIPPEKDAADTIGPFVHPFKKNLTVERDGFLFSIGNLTLCHLNLAYNNLTIHTLKKILAVLEHQSKIDQTLIDNGGLLNVVFEGNIGMPSICDELNNMNDILEDLVMKQRRSTLSSKSPRKSAKQLPTLITPEKSTKQLPTLIMPEK